MLLLPLARSDSQRMRKTPITPPAIHHFHVHNAFHEHCRALTARGSRQHRGSNLGRPVALRCGVSAVLFMFTDDQYAV